MKTNTDHGIVVEVVIVIVVVSIVIVVVVAVHVVNDVDYNLKTNYVNRSMLGHRISVMVQSYHRWEPMAKKH
jgi:hypothetical protein